MKITRKKDSVIRDDLAQTLTVGIHFAFLGAVTVATARPFLFPSLGPSAYLLAAGEGEKEAQSGPYNVVGGHFIAVVCGLIAYHFFAPDLLILRALDTGSLSEPILRLGASSIVGMMLTTFGMLVSGTNHPAAAATTLIVALGLISDPTGAAFIVVAVVLLVLVHERVIYPMTTKLGFEPDDPRRV